MMFWVGLYRADTCSDPTGIYAVLVEFNVMLGMNITGKFSWEALPELVGLNATGEALIAQLIRMDTADAFSISANNVLVNVLGE